MKQKLRYAIDRGRLGKHPKIIVLIQSQDLLDEHAQSIFVQILNKMFFLLEYFGDNVGREHVLPVLSVFGTIGFIVAIGYLLAYLVRMEEEDIQKRQSTKNNNNNGILQSIFLLPLPSI